MKKQVVFFRGRNTSRILADAQAAGLVEEREVVVICREGDALAEPGDVPIGEFRRTCFTCDVVDILVICNGGTTRQQVPVVLQLAYIADYMRQERYPARVRFVEIEPGGEVVELGEG